MLKQGLFIDESGTEYTVYEQAVDSTGLTSARRMRTSTQMSGLLSSLS